MLKRFKRKFLNFGAYYVSRLKLIPVLRSLNKDSVVFDCGANRGEISYLFAKRAKKVLSFEPDPMAFEILKEKCANFDNIEFINKAVGSSAGEFDLFLHEQREQDDNEEFTVSSSLVEEKVNVDKSNSVKVEVLDFVELVENFGEKIDLVKMDIEGAEIRILEKMIEHKTYEKIGLMIVETHENKIPSHVPRLEKIKQDIKELGITNIGLNWV